MLPCAFADVWIATNKWNEDWEEQFSQWVKSEKVNKTIFVSSKSKYKGIVADCADVSYVFRAIFSFENNLSFSAKNPMATSQTKLKVFSEKMTNFDSIKDPHKRVVAFANYLGKSLGSETLVANDSYPLKLEKIRAGDFYLYKKKMNEQFTRHNYNIKNIDKRGNFELIYSTQAIRDRVGASLGHKIKGLYYAPIDYKWGFRRYNDGVSSEIIQASEMKEAYSFEQYKLAADLGERKFFAYVKSLLRDEIEEPDMAFKNQLKEICEQVLERVEVVELGLAYKTTLNGACMDFSKYDAHSTPARDGRLRDLMTNIKLDYQDLTNEEKNKLSIETLELLDGYFSNDPSVIELEAIKNFCPISYRSDSVVSLRQIRQRLFKGLLSSNPNDKLSVRWGETSEGKTKCPAYY